MRVVVTNDDKNFSFASLYEVVLIEQSIKCRKVDECV